MAAAGPFKRPAAPAQHPPLRACPSRGARGGGLGRSGSSSRVGTKLGVGGWGKKSVADIRTPGHRTSIDCDSAPGPVEGSGGRREGGGDRGGGGSSIRSRAAAAPPFVLRPRSPRGESRAELWRVGARDGSGFWDLGAEGGSECRCGGVGEGGAGMLRLGG